MRGKGRDEKKIRHPIVSSRNKIAYGRELLVPIIWGKESCTSEPRPRIL